MVKKHKGKMNHLGNRNLMFNEETNELIRKKKKGIKLSKGIDPELLEVVDGVLVDYKEALYNLKGK